MTGYIDYKILTALSVVLLIVSFFDIRSKRIPNIFSLGIAISGVTYNYIVASQVGLSTALTGFLMGLFVTLVFYRYAGLGAGDVKLIAAIGCWVGYKLVFFIIAYSYVTSALLSVVYIIIWVPWYQKRTRVSNDDKPPQVWVSQPIPMAPGIGLATFYVLCSYPL